MSAGEARRAARCRGRLQRARAHSDSPSIAPLFAQVELVLPLRARPSLFVRCCLLLFGVYLAWQLLHLAAELRFLLEVRAFYSQRLGLSDGQLGAVGWDEVVRRLVALQAASKFVIVKASAAPPRGARASAPGGRVCGAPARRLTGAARPARPSPPSAAARRSRSLRTTWRCACCAARTGWSRW